MKDFAKCKSPDEFRALVADPGEGGHCLPSSYFIHRSVFEVFGKEGSMRAEYLAMRAMWNFSTDNEDDSWKEEAHGDPKKRTHLLLFLWSVKSYGINKVSLRDPPNNDIFDSLAQKSMKKLDKEETPIEKLPNEKARTSSDEHPLTKNQLPSAYFSNSSSSVRQSISPSDRPSRHSKTDWIKSQKAPPGSPDRSSIAKFRERGRERGRRERKERKEGEKGKGSLLRDQAQDHPRQSRSVTMTVTPPPRRASRYGR